MSEDQSKAVVSIRDGDGDLTVALSEQMSRNLNMEFRQRKFREALACAAGCAVGPMSEDDYELAVKRLNEAQVMLRAMWVIKHKEQP